MFQELNLSNEEDSEDEDKSESVDDTELEALAGDLALLENLSLGTDVTHMRCGVHTLQLAIQDGLKQSRIKDVIGRARNVAVQLRIPKTHELLKKNYKLVAVLDQETRWGSTFQMVDRIIQLREAIKDMCDGGNDKLFVAEAHWNEIIGLRDLLKMAYDITIRLQYSDVTPGYFFRKWTGLQMCYEEHGSSLGTEIASSMKKRESKLFNEPLLAAVFLDVHNQHLLSNSQKVVAKETVINIALRMKGIDCEDNEEPFDESRAEDDREGEDSDSDSDQEMSQIRKRIRTQETSEGKGRRQK